MAISPFYDARFRRRFLEAAEAALEEQKQKEAAAEPDHDFPVGWDERDALV